MVRLDTRRLSPAPIPSPMVQSISLIFLRQPTQPCAESSKNPLTPVGCVGSEAGCDLASRGLRLALFHGIRTTAIWKGRVTKNGDSKGRARKRKQAQRIRKKE